MFIQSSYPGLYPFFLKIKAYSIENEEDRQKESKKFSTVFSRLNPFNSLAFEPLKFDYAYLSNRTVDEMTHQIQADLNNRGEYWLTKNHERPIRLIDPKTQNPSLLYIQEQLEESFSYLSPNAQNTYRLQNNLNTQTQEHIQKELLTAMLFAATQDALNEILIKLSQSNTTPLSFSNLNFKVNFLISDQELKVEQIAQATLVKCSRKTNKFTSKQKEITAIALVNYLTDKNKMVIEVKAKEY